MADNFDRLRNRPVRTTTVTLALNPDDGDKLTQARNALARATTRAEFNPEDGAAAQAMAEAEAELERVKAEVVTFTIHMRGIGPVRVEELVAQHKPTGDQVRAAKREDPKAHLGFNYDTLPPAFLAESVTSITFSDDPDHPIESLSVSQATELWTSRWSSGDKMLIWQTAQMLDAAPSMVGDLGND